MKGGQKCLKPNVPSTVLHCVYFYELLYLFFSLYDFFDENINVLLSKTEQRVFLSKIKKN